MNKKGRPPGHKPIMHKESGNVYDTYSEAARAINGNRWGVRYTAMGIQSSHKGQHFIFINRKKTNRIT